MSYIGIFYDRGNVEVGRNQPLNDKLSEGHGGLGLFV